MKTNRIAMLTVLALTATAQIARAEMTRPVRPDLLAAQQSLAWRAQNTKGIQSETLRSEGLRLDTLIGDLSAALPAFAEAISNTYFSHAQMERAT